MLVYDRKTGQITHSTISQINSFLPKDCAIIMNDTKVIKARLYGQKESGANIELLYIRDLSRYEHEVLIKGKVKAGTTLTFGGGLSAKVLKLNDDGSRIVSLHTEQGELDFVSLLPFLDAIGHIPLPPYMEREDTLEDSSNYQSRFAINEGSVAAPTASLHFDDELLKRLQESHRSAFVTLHIGLGTFKNVEASDIREHQIHTERYQISDHAKDLIDSETDILCIGTTACRSVEYYFAQKKQSGECDIFLHIENKPKRVNHLLTNFHLPKSTLIMLVSSMIGLEKTLELYELAIKNEYRFYSFGDAMLIL